MAYPITQPTNNLARTPKTGLVVNNAAQKEKLQHKKAFRAIRFEKIFKGGLPFTGILILALFTAIGLTLVIYAFPSVKALGFSFFWGKVWNPVEHIFGGFPFLIGTLITSFMALIIAVPFALSVAIFLGEYFPKGWLSGFLKGAIDLIAAVPSVIFGFWGFFVLVPVIRNIEFKLGLPANGLGILPAALILAMMIIPYAASLATTMIKMVPADLKEGAYALGATRWEVLKNVIIPKSRSGILSGFLLALGRAIGETMAVTMVIGNANIIPTSIFSTGNTMASVIANEFSEADSPVYFSALIELGLFLFVVTLVINMIGKTIINRTKIS
ncbi:MAG TPA: phosphate ABC transporter permease subunit PstC [Edaphocola sp.]|nr:phosphate ABC transporter permease subunit PstC [Edaphocola sp.]